MNQEKLSNIIKEIRKKNNLTQKQLAEKLNVTYQAVSKWENGKNFPDIAILKKISEEFNIDISLLLDAPNNKKKLNKWFTIIIVVIIFLVIFIIAFTKKDFSFKKITSSCETFNITGSIAFNKDKSSIYISNIDYCGEEDKNIYSKITCSLYEKHNNEVVLISICDEKENITLDNYLENLSINVNDYKSTCNLYKENDIYIEINLYNNNDKITKFNIPLEFKENCIN